MGLSDTAWSGEMADVGIFVGNYTHTLDAKKRLIVPSDWREMAGEPKRLFVLPGIKKKCLCVYPAREMTRILEKLRTLSSTDEKGRQLKRALASHSDLVPWDSQGRIRIKDNLLDYAELEGPVLLQGTFTGFELWNPENNRLVDLDTELPTLADEASMSGFDDLL